MSNVILEVKDIKKSFKSRHISFKKLEVLKGINLTINEQQKIAIVGKNGSGKTTLAKIIAGFTQQTSGEILYNYDYEISPKEKIALQFQSEIDFYRPYVKNIYKDLILGFKKFLDMEFVNKLGEILMIKKYMKRRYDRLSGGERKKVDLFFTLYNKPKIVILDEFTSGLDTDTRVKIREVVENYIEKYQATLILISHNANEIRKLANEIYVLEDGVFNNHIENIQGKFTNDDDLETFIRQITNTIDEVKL
ncbi:ABC transporter ATP-binding protein [Mycoplasma anatis]|uniref:ABC transporter ATP-binding protein n=3 Tax=Mycoplasmopsis anatis TaxID=171279 RepID=UPI001C4DFB16|nr:ABC transporter ATP-binding protein [Mycoplasmopsis anatis]MBW0594895.1 ABC transporter ATP-binding protein [Mycoplasmopsis anatis]MBW0599254.1 ABC transporter ATP-binding protein [Mycoplasmopsis anatis]MBW0601468.1 ABC transporter ATP-binding protein [Mycoplasmopsis anatis]